MSELKYKEGDKVLIKSIDWYNKYKDEDGDVLCGEFAFLEGMKKFCSETLTILEDVDDGYLMLEDDLGYVWTDEMFERLVERNGKTYPYKIGDRVVLKGNNRCATITDLKYNSWGNLSYYIKVDNDKDISTDYPTDLLLPYDNKIKGGLMEEETKSKFKVGDKITNGNVTLTILSLLSDRYVVEDTFGKCGTLYFNSQDEWKIVEEEIKPKFKVGDRVFNKATRKWVNIIEFDIETGLYIVRYDDGIQGRSLESELCETQPSVKDTEEREVSGVCQECVFAVNDNNPHCGLRGFRNDFNVTSCSAKNNVIPNGFELQSDGYFSWVNKKKYPKNYEECAEIIAELTGSDYNPKGCMGYMSVQLTALQKLLVCRAAYWKIAGDEMGLGKPWEPTNETVCCISRSDNVIKCSYRGGKSNILEFPDPEMRDAFYESFGPDIEICKELL